MLGLQFFSFSLIFYVVFMSAVLGIAFIVYISAHKPAKTKQGADDFILSERQQNVSGYISTADKKKFLGAIGTCSTDLRPAGTVMVEGEPLDVVTEGNFLKQGSIVKIINVDGSRILVRQI